MVDQLKQLRDKIDAIDSDLLKLVSARAGLAQQIGQLKNGSAYRPEREAQVLARLQKLNPGPLPNEHVARLFTEIMSLCRSLEASLSVAYLGPEGTFSEQAALSRFGSAVLGIPCATIDEVFRSVENGGIKFGVVPVENSSEGAVGRTLDLLLQSTVHVCGEIMLPIHQCLLAKDSNRGTKPSINTVYSHPQSLGQCQGWLNTHLPQAVRIPVASNAEAARLESTKPQSAAIASERAAGYFNLSVRMRNIEDDPKNTTRFLVIGAQEVAASGKDKTSLVMSVKNRPGAVHDLLAPLAKHGVSMSRLESRPSRAGLWEYVFYVDIEGHQQDAKVAKALAELREKAAFLKVLGSYPAA